MVDLPLLIEAGLFVYFFGSYCCYNLRLMNQIRFLEGWLPLLHCRMGSAAFYKVIWSLLLSSDIWQDSSFGFHHPHRCIQHRRSPRRRNQITADYGCFSLRLLETPANKGANSICIILSFRPLLFGSELESLPSSLSFPHSGSYTHPCAKTQQ